GRPPHLLHQQLGQPFDRAHVLADLRALEVVSAVQPRAQHEVPGQQRPRAREDVEDFLLARVHPATLEEPREKTKSILRVAAGRAYAVAAVNKPPTLPLEDE